jgi:hypothetical protein
MLIAWLIQIGLECVQVLLEAFLSSVYFYDESNLLLTFQLIGAEYLSGRQSKVDKFH